MAVVDIQGNDVNRAADVDCSTILVTILAV